MCQQELQMVSIYQLQVGMIVVIIQVVQDIDKNILSIELLDVAEVE
jgi:hypothetical protein